MHNTAAEQARSQGAILILKSLETGESITLVFSPGETRKTGTLVIGASVMPIDFALTPVPGVTADTIDDLTLAIVPSGYTPITSLPTRPATVELARPSAPISDDPVEETWTPGRTDGIGNELPPLPIAPTPVPPVTAAPVQPVATVVKPSLPQPPATPVVPPTVSTAVPQPTPPKPTAQPRKSGK